MITGSSAISARCALLECTVWDVANAYPWGDFIAGDAFEGKRLGCPPAGMGSPSPQMKWKPAALPAAREGKGLEMGKCPNSEKVQKQADSRQSGSRMERGHDRLLCAVLGCGRNET